MAYLPDIYWEAKIMRFGLTEVGLLSAIYQANYQTIMD